MPQCYMCEADGTTRDHYPPKAFFPRGQGLQLKTVPACSAHNNSRSRDDQYLLTHICMNEAGGDNLAKQIFNRSVRPMFDRSPAFRAMINEGAEWVADGGRRYPVDVARFNNVFNGLCHAIFYDRYDQRFDPVTHSMRHVYMSLHSDDPDITREQRVISILTRKFFSDFQHMIERDDAAHVDEIIYSHHIADPAGPDTSITISHTFYGVFNVVSLLTRQLPGVLRPPP